MRIRFILSIAAAWAMAVPSVCTAQALSVTIGTIPATSFCSGDPISVSFTATGYWQHKNAFTLQLSDASGSFTSGFTNLGSIKDTLPGTFTIRDTIPGNLAGSTHYRFRIMGALPYTVSADNGSDISVGAKPTINIYFPTHPVEAVVGSPILISEAWSSNNDTLYWDYGSGATPATYVGRNNGEDSIIYSTGGLKIVSLRVVSPGGCSAIASDSFWVYDCTSPQVPHDAIVVSNDTILRGYNQTYWVNPGVTAKMFGAGQDTVFAESGSTIVNNEDVDVFYVKQGAMLRGNDYVGVAVFAEGASVLNMPFSLSCPSLNFDYTNAPPNVAMPAGVTEPVAPVAITLAPNPTRGIVNVAGLPLNARDISLENVLGARVGQWVSSGSHQLNLDLSKDAPGTYYFRFVSGTGVITKKIVLQ